MLETSLVSGDALYIKFPFEAGAPTSAVVSAAFTGTTATTISTTISNTNFYTLGGSLSASQWYQVVVTIGSTGMATQVAGVAGCVRFATTSTTTGDYIIYDENRCFDVLSFAPAVNTQDLAVTGYRLYSASSYLNPGSSYSVNFDVVPNVNVAGGATYVFTIASDFTFVAPCSSIACTANTGETGTDYCPVNITALTAAQYTCTVASNVLTYVVNTDINAGNYTRFQVQVSAPSKYVASAVAVSAQLRSKNAPIIFSTKAVTAGSINGIDLRTDLATVSAALYVRLFWGLTPTTVANRATGFIGCPINFYASHSYRIFNSFRTYFTPAAQIIAYPVHNNIQATWTLVSTNVIQTVVQSSFSTNLPGTLTFTFSDATVTIAGITTLSASTAYWLGIKFSLNPTTVQSGTYIATQSATPGSLTWGAVSLSAGNASKTLGTFGGVVVQVRFSMIYQTDLTTLTTSRNVFGYQAFTYWSSSDGATPAMGDSTTAGTAFTALLAGTTNPYTSGIWAKPTSVSTTNVQALLIQLYLPAGSICKATSPDYAAGSDFIVNQGNSPVTAITSLCTAQSYDDTNSATDSKGPESRVLLKLGFNNNVLRLGTAERGYGKRIGGLFPTTDTTTAFTTSARLSTATDLLENYISGSSITGLYYLSLLCKDVALTATGTTAISCYSSTDYVEAGNTFSGVALINTNIATYPTPYADSNVQIGRASCRERV